MENLGIDYKLIIAQIVNFGIFFFIFRKFISSSFLKMLHTQKKEDQLREELIKELESRKAKLDEENRAIALERKKILDRALDESKKEAAVVKDEIIQQAKKQSEELLAKAQSQLESDREKLMKDLRKQIAQVSMMVVEKALHEYLTPDAQKVLTHNIINLIPEDTKLGK